jgi:hypothetical protein
MSRNVWPVQVRVLEEFGIPGILQQVEAARRGTCNGVHMLLRQDLHGVGRAHLLIDAPIHIRRVCHTHVTADCNVHICKPTL